MSGRQSNKASTEGQRLLLELRVKRAEVADACGVSGPLVSQWRSGKKRPSAAGRRVLEETFGIPAGAWDLAPGSQVTPSVPPAGNPVPAPAPAAVPSPSLGAGRLTTIEGVNREIDLLEEMREENLMPSERIKLSDTAGKFYAIRARIEKDAELYEDRVVKAAPFWRRARSAILEAVRPFPDAARAMAEALEELEREAE